MKTVPLSGTSRPAMMRSTVDLPPPLGPSSAVSEPGGHLEGDVVEGDCVAEALRDRLDFDAHRSCLLLRAADAQSAASTIRRDQPRAESAPA
jgi:hypothetical protein